MPALEGELGSVERMRAALNAKPPRRFDTDITHYEMRMSGGSWTHTGRMEEIWHYNGEGQYGTAMERAYVGPARRLPGWSDLRSPSADSVRAEPEERDEVREARRRTAFFEATNRMPSDRELEDWFPLESAAGACVAPW